VPSARPGRRPFVIGLTGNIASGKSLVGQTLVRLRAEHGDVCHIDADQLSREVMAPGTDVFRQIVDVFGAGIVSADGALDRAKLGEIVFDDPAALARLEAIVHPAVIARTERRISQAAARGSPVVVVEAIKLIESGMVRRLCDVLWVVTAPREVRLERLVRQRGMDRVAAQQRIDAQPPEADKVAHADVVIDNSGTVDETVRQVERNARETGFFAQGASRAH
jgi:dephospho-CoA kinase